MIDSPDLGSKRAAEGLLAALKALLNKAYKQNWNDAYPDQVAQAEAAIEAYEAQRFGDAIC